jgi:hypothetical protein
MTAVLLILIVSLIRSASTDLSPLTVYVLFTIQIALTGIQSNLNTIIFATKINPKYISTCLELNFCISQFIVAACPILAKMDEPVPTAT